MHEFTLRSGTAEDVVSMYALDLQCFDERFQFDEPSIRRFAGLPGVIVVVAETSTGVLCGFTIITQQRLRKLPSRGYVVTLDVAPGWRRRGVAGALMAEAESRARVAAVGTIALHVFVGNHGAIGFYEASGFVRAEAEPGFYGDGFDAWRFEKPLAPNS